MENQFGYKIKQIREENNLLQRQVATFLDIDTPMLSKIERGERKAKKEQVILFATALKFNKDELLTLWLADQVYDLIQGQPMAEEVLKTVSKQIGVLNK